MFTFKVNVKTALNKHHFRGVGKIDQGKYARKQVKTNNYMTSNDLARQNGETISLKNLQF